MVRAVQPKIYRQTVRLKGNFMFQKAIVVGCPGAGKSTLARRMSEKTQLPAVYELLDRYKNEKSIHIFRSRPELDDYLKMFSQNRPKHEIEV